MNKEKEKEIIENLNNDINDKMIKHNKQIISSIINIYLHLKNKNNEIKNTFIQYYELIKNKKDNEKYNVEWINEIEKIKIDNDYDCNDLIFMLKENMKIYNIMMTVKGLR
jgi:hypothetical protein